MKKTTKQKIQKQAGVFVTEFPTLFLFLSVSLIIFSSAYNWGFFHRIGTDFIELLTVSDLLASAIVTIPKAILVIIAVIILFPILLILMLYIPMKYKWGDWAIILWMFFTASFEFQPLSRCTARGRNPYSLTST